MPAAARATIDEVVESLEASGPAPAAPPARTPFEAVLFEIASYLVDDERRLEVHRRLERDVGLTPKAILASKPARLLAAIEAGGMKPEMRAERVREAAGIAQDLGDLDTLAKGDLGKAVKAFAAFPAIGVPGAEKILLFVANRPIPALESNGLRVLERLGYAPAGKAYTATYRAVRATLGKDGEHDAAFWKRAHLVLRRHGREVCRRNDPLCRRCPLLARCPTGRARTGG